MKTPEQNEENMKEPLADVIGRYIIKHPLFVIFKPRLKFYRKEKSGKVTGEISWMGLKKKLKLAKHKDHHWVFQFQVDIITIDVIINFINIDTFEGFIDTPVGHFMFTGRKVVKS